MRHKIILIRGSLNLSRKITIGEYERINADHVLLMTSLKHSYLIPNELFVKLDDFQIQDIPQQINDSLRCLKQENSEHLLFAEYADFVLNHRINVKAVEGHSLCCDWFYETVRSYHKSQGHTVITCESTNFGIEIDGEFISTEAVIDRLSGPEWLG